MRFRYFFTLFLLLLMVGCSTATTPAVPAPTVAQSGDTNQSYPAPANAASDPGYPVPTETVGTNTPMPTIDPSLGSVKGALYVKGQPVYKAVLFLSDVIKDNKGNDSVVSIDYSTPYRAETEKDGSFNFVNIPLKRYALVLVVFPNSYVLLNPKDQSSMVVAIKQGETVDMGKLDYDDLPLRPTK